jgi:uncharacterized coiled-coil DUF342 family protein
LDTKAKKRLDVINKKLQSLRQQVAGAKKQNDDPDELRGMEKEITQLEAEASKLRG